MRIFRDSPSDKLGSRNFMKIKKQESYALDREVGLGLAHLKERGLKGMLIEARKLETAPDLLDYILDTAHGL